MAMPANAMFPARKSNIRAMMLPLIVILNAITAKISRTSFNEIHYHPHRNQCYQEMGFFHWGGNKPAQQFLERFSIIP